MNEKQVHEGEYLEQTRLHEQIVAKLLDELGLEEEEETPVAPQRALRLAVWR